jgi:hypothetical protein
MSPQEPWGRGRIARAGTAVFPDKPRYRRIQPVGTTAECDDVGRVITVVAVVCLVIGYVRCLERHENGTTLSSIARSVCAR